MSCRFKFPLFTSGRQLFIICVLILKIITIMVVLSLQGRHSTDHYALTVNNFFLSSKDDKFVTETRIKGAMQCFGVREKMLVSSNNTFTPLYSLNFLLKTTKTCLFAVSRVGRGRSR